MEAGKPKGEVNVAKPPGELQTCIGDSVNGDAGPWPLLICSPTGSINGASVENTMRPEGLESAAMADPKPRSEAYGVNEVVPEPDADIAATAAAAASAVGC